MNGKQVMPALVDGVTIRRDRYGIPHIDAQNEHDAWFGMGFACARDRLWQLEWYRRRGEGRWAEVAGASGIDDDVFFRRMGLAASSQTDVANMSSDTRSMFDSYAAGVNGFLESRSPLPAEYGLAGLEPEPWEPWHSILLFKVRHAVMGKWQIKLARTELVRRIGAEAYRLLESLQPEGQNIIDPPGGRTMVDGGVPRETVEALTRLAAGFEDWGSDWGGSNSWAMHGSRVTTGKPVVCNDSHRPLDVPNVYWQVHVSCPAFNAAGGAFPGFPAFPHFGHNECVVWCITHAMADNQDLYLEKFQADDPSLYLTEDGWQKAEIRQSTIRVRDGKPHTAEVVRTRHGTVIAGDRSSGSALALRYTATDRPGRQWECLRPMLCAKTVEHLFEAQREWVDPVNNLVSADTEGTIGYLTRGRLPVRATRDGQQFVVPGWTGEHEWTGDVPFEKLPRIVNPSQGFIVTANQRIRNGENPYIAYDFAPPGRAERIAERLEGSNEMTPEQIASIQADTLSIRARGWARVFGSLTKTAALQGGAGKAVELLSGWDGDLRPESPQALLYSFFRVKLAQEVFEPLVGPETWRWMVGRPNPGAESLLSGWLYNLGDRITRFGPEQPAPDGRRWEEVLPRVLEAAWEETAALTGTYDPTGWRWDAHHRTSAVHTLAEAFPENAERLNPLSVAMSGDGDTIQVSSYTFSAGYTAGTSGDGFPVHALSVYRQVVDLGDIAHSRWVIPAGASGRAESDHYSDQLELWHRHQLAPMHFAPEEVKANAVHELVLRSK
jgi:penicillin amidase